MQTIVGKRPVAQVASEFLSLKRIAVTGVSKKKPGAHGSNAVYERLRARGYDVFAVNPNADSIDGAPSYPNLTSIPGGVDAVVIGTRPDRAQATMRECVDLGIKYAWMHRSVDAGSVSPAAVDFGRAHGITVIPGGCPLMFEPASDGAHKVMKFVFTLTGAVPREA